jgi:hypothetical protein
MRRSALLPALLLLLVRSAFAQIPTLHTESAVVLGAGIIQVGLGAEYFSKHDVPAPDLPLAELRLGEAFLHWGVSRNVDFDVDWRGRLFARYAGAGRGADWGDATISTKLSILREEEAPLSFAIRSAVKLPNTMYHPYMLGSNQTDYSLQGLASRRFDGVELRMNLGIDIVGNPSTLESQDDIYACGAALMFPLAPWLHPFVELEGFAGYFGADDKKAAARLGAVIDVAGFSWNIFGDARIIGNNRDIGTAFESSEDWSVGVFVAKSIGTP